VRHRPCRGALPIRRNGNDIIGTLYEQGQGVAQDYAEAIRWYRKAADQGASDAKDRLMGLDKRMDLKNRAGPPQH